MTIGSPSSSSIAPQLRCLELAGPRKLPAPASRSEPTETEDPARAPLALPAVPNPQLCRELSSQLRTLLCGTLHDSFLPGIHNTSGKTAPEAVCPRRNPPACSGAAAGSPAPVREKAPGDGGSGGGTAARARACSCGARAGSAPGLDELMTCLHAGFLAPCWSAG